MKVFLSHALADEKLARRLGSVLEKAGLEVWDAERDIMPGDNWAEKTSQALQNAEAMVVLLTPEALRSNALRREIDFALGNKGYNAKRVIPVIVGGEDQLAAEEMPWILKKLQVVTIPEPSEIDEGARQVIDALSRAA